MSQIGTVEYTITKLIIADDDAFYKIGARKTIFSCKVKAKAGVDMKDFTGNTKRLLNCNRMVRCVS